MKINQYNVCMRSAKQKFDSQQFNICGRRATELLTSGERFANVSLSPLFLSSLVGDEMLEYYFKPRKVVKIYRDHHCDVCRRNLKNQYHTELNFIITVRVCPECRDTKRNFIQYLTSKDVSISIQKIVGWLADMKLLDIKLPLEIPKQINPSCIFKPRKLAIKMAA